MDLLGLNSLRIISNQITELDEEKEKIKILRDTYKRSVSEENCTNIQIQIDELNKKLTKIQNFDKDVLLEEIDELIKRNNYFHSERNNLLNRKYFCLNRIETITAYLQNIDNSPTNIVNFIKQVECELGKIIEIKMENALEYHRILTSERVELLNNEKQKLLKEIDEIEKKIKKINSEIEPIQNRINEKDEIKKYIDSQKTLIDELSKLSVEKAFSLEIENSNNLLNEITKDKLTKLTELNNVDISKEKEKFSKYTLDFVKKLYGEGVQSFFDIKIKDAKNINKLKYPVDFIFNISKDSSEGVKNVRNIVIDLMMLKYSEEIKCMIWDSTTFNGIDPKQLKILLDEMKAIVNETKKQVIVCISSFQLEKYYTSFKNDLDAKDMIVLNENELLLKKRF